jgi:hypothetical protein
MGEFAQHREIKDVSVLRMEKIFDPFYSIPEEDYLKKEFAEVFAEKLVNEGFIQIRKDYDQLLNRTKYNAKLCVAPYNFTNVIINDYEYELNNMTFSQKELDEALRNTWPEKFL